jgi:hypothetical protein
VLTDRAAVSGLPGFPDRISRDYNPETYHGRSASKQVSITGAAQQPPAKTAAELDKLGPQVGEHVPDFNLPDQNGTTRTLDSLLGPGGAMIVFFRSADW